MDRKQQILNELVRCVSLLQQELVEEEKERAKFRSKITVINGGLSKQPGATNIASACSQKEQKQ